MGGGDRAPRARQRRVRRWDAAFRRIVLLMVELACVETRAVGSRSSVPGRLGRHFASGATDSNFLFSAAVVDVRAGHRTPVGVLDLDR